jgi:pilus assembly protein CpaF
MGQYVDHWQEAVQSRYPQLLRHLVWDRDRLNQLEEAINQVIGEEGLDLSAMTLYRRSLLNRLTGLGPLDALLTDDKVTDIMVNGPERIFCERDGHIEQVKQHFDTPEDVALLAQRLASRAGRVLNTESPLCDAQLVDGSRIHCVLPPVADQPTITIRRARQEPLSLDDYLLNGSLSMELWEDFITFIKERRNILVAGGAGSGKTSLLRLLTSVIGEDERLITIEDVRELNLNHANTVSLEMNRHYSIYDLVINSLRMRPDRIIVGEVRGEEAMELIEAMSTGHLGSLSTVHSQSGGADTILRLARMCSRRQLGISFDRLTEQIRETLDIIIYVRRYPDGVRRIESVQQPLQNQMNAIWQYQTGQAPGFVKVGRFYA